MKKQVISNFLFFIAILTIISCKSSNETNFILILNNRDCITCEAGAISKITNPEFHNILVENSVKVILPSVREVEQNRIITDYNLNDLVVTFNDNEYNKYQTMINSNQTSIIKINNDSLVKWETINDFNIYNTDFFE